jgi:hypothetical protein
MEAKFSEYEDWRVRELMDAEENSPRQVTGEEFGIKPLSEMMYPNHPDTEQWRLIAQCLDGHNNQILEQINAPLFAKGRE